MDRHSAARGARWMLAAGLATATCAQAAPASGDSRMLADLRTLASQKPWTCVDAGPRAPDAAWQGGAAECAWQNRLRKRTWRWQDGGPADCVSRQARWWSWVHTGLPPAAPRLPWHAAWSGQSDSFALDGEQRVVILERERDGAWSASEWRWNPSPRAATRRWQEGRWKLLTDLAARRRAAVPAIDGANGTNGAAGRLRAVFGAVLGARPGEIVPGAMRMETDGACLTLADPLPGQSRLPLSYRPDDSRLEQRAAMHLLLSRQYPQATWLAPFHLVDMPPEAAGGAKFMAVWLEGAHLDSQLKGQLWMPSKEGGQTVRVRMTTPVRAGAPTLGRIQRIVEGELRALAVRWARFYE